MMEGYSTVGYLSRICGQFFDMNPNSPHLVLLSLTTEFEYPEFIELKKLKG